MSLGNLPTSSSLASGSPGNEKKSFSNENSLIVENLPKRNLQQHNKEEGGGSEKGDVLSSQQPTSSMAIAARGNDKCLKNRFCTESNGRDVVGKNNDDNNSQSESNLTSLSLLNGKAPVSLDLSVHCSSSHLKHDLNSNEQGLNESEKGKNTFAIFKFNKFENFINIRKQLS